MAGKVHFELHRMTKHTKPKQLSDFVDTKGIDTVNTDDLADNPGKISMHLKLDSENVAWEFMYHPSTSSEFRGKSLVPISKPENMNMATEAIQLIDHFVSGQEFNGEKAGFLFELQLGYKIEGEDIKEKIRLQERTDNHQHAE